MAKKDFTTTSKILLLLLMTGEMLMITPRELMRRAKFGKPLGDDKNFLRTARYLEQKGWIRFVDKHNERFVKLTKKGELRALLVKAKNPEIPKTWDGRWRMVIFDIPEASNSQRNFFRYLLKKNGFIQLQASVYVSPYPLNREAIKYLQESHLIDYIRIAKIEEMDNDSDLRKKFKI